MAALPGTKAPSEVHPRRASSPYLLSGLIKCRTCQKALTAHEAQGGKYTYYVCHSLLKRGKGTCDTPRLNSKRFERLIIDQLREHVLTESNIRDLVRMVDEEMDGVAREQRQKLETVEEELAEVRRRMDRLWHAVETSDLEINDILLPRIRQHQERQERLEVAADEARAMLEERRALLDGVDVITAYARDMNQFLRTSEVTESRAFIQSFVKEIVVKPGTATIRYTIPTPPDSPIGGRMWRSSDCRGELLVQSRLVHLTGLYYELSSWLWSCSPVTFSQCSGSPLTLLCFSCHSTNIGMATLSCEKGCARFYAPLAPGSDGLETGEKRWRPSTEIESEHACIGLVGHLDALFTIVQHVLDTHGCSKSRISRLLEPLQEEDFAEFRDSCVHHTCHFLQAPTRTVDKSVLQNIDILP